MNNVIQFIERLVHSEDSFICPEDFDKLEDSEFIHFLQNWIIYILYKTHKNERFTFVEMHEINNIWRYLDKNYRERLFTILREKKLLDLQEQWKNEDTSWNVGSVFMAFEGIDIGSFQELGEDSMKCCIDKLSEKAHQILWHLWIIRDIYGWKDEIMQIFYNARIEFFTASITELQQRLKELENNPHFDSSEHKRIIQDLIKTFAKEIWIKPHELDPNTILGMLASTHRDEYEIDKFLIPELFESFRRWN